MKFVRVLIFVGLLINCATAHFNDSNTGPQLTDNVPRSRKLRKRVKFVETLHPTTTYHTTTTEEFDVNSLQLENEEQTVEFQKVYDSINKTKGKGYHLKFNMSEEAAKSSAAADTANFIMNDTYYDRLKFFRNKAPVFIPNAGNETITPIIHRVWRNCGVRRTKRFAVNQGSVWDHDNITWSLFTDLLPTPYTRNQIASEIQQSFLTWQTSTVWLNKTVIYFTQLHDNNTAANIKLRFARREHNDGNPFDGRGRVLAHTYLPPSGNVHFDVDEDWRLLDEENQVSDEGISLYLVATHEIGHALGMLHTSVKQAMMYWYYDSGNHIQKDDINGISQLYVDNPRRFTTERITTTTTQAPTTTTTRRPVNEHNLIFERLLPEWLYETSPSVLESCAAPPNDLLMLDDDLYMTINGKVWSYNNNGSVIQEGVRLDSLWNDLCEVDAMVQLEENLVIATRGNVWYEYYRNGSLKSVGRVQDVMEDSNITKIDCFIVEHDGGQPRLYATYANKFYVFQNKRVVYSGMLRYKFRGIGMRLDYFVHFNGSGVSLAGVGRGFWSVKVISNDNIIGNVYQAIKRVQRLMDHC